MTATVLDDPAVRDALDRSADPALARGRLSRLVDAHPWLASELRADPGLVEAAVAVVGASRSLFAFLERDPVAITMLRSDALDDGARSDDVAAVVAGDDPPRALRRWKRREVVRVAGRDLTGRSDLRTVGAELAAVARASLEAALATAQPGVAVAVIGMGKLGGDELNYASDVDILFVHDGDTAEAERVARSVMATMSRPGVDGIVFRTDAALRPEGRAGVLSRSIDGYASYWERWARPWELQALIKAAPAAGDAGLAAAFVGRAAPFVWPDTLDPDAIRELRALKQRGEELVRRRGLAQHELKRGEGGIRDVEFAVQLLQLVHGRLDPALRGRGTLVALEQLAAGGYVHPRDAALLDDAYVWLRTVEHRLQLVDEQQTHTLPHDAESRTRLARVLGFRDRPDASALAAFEARHARHRGAVRSIHERLYFAPLLDTLAGASGALLAPDAADERLGAFGFRDVERARSALAELRAGITRRSRVMQQLLPVLLGWLSAAPDPDLGLLQLRRLTEGATRASAVARRFRESPVAAQRACVILGSSRVLGRSMHRQPDFLDLLADDGELARERPRAELVDEALDALDWREDDEGRLAGLRRFKRRHLLRIGARDVLRLADQRTGARELSAVADATIEAALAALDPSIGFAVIGLGRLGGEELSYASDVDVVFAHDGRGPAATEEAERLATGLVRAVGAMTSEGQAFRIDTRLRPEGAPGAPARSLDGYRTYYERWAQVWELQALTKARFVAGDAGIGARFVELAHGWSYRDPIPEGWTRAIRRMKARVERERIPRGEDPRFHLKLGRGALSDVEFTVQLLQLAHGARHPEVTVASTADALRALHGIGAIDGSDTARLGASFDYCERARNARYLLTGISGDALPLDGDEALALARALGYTHRPVQSMRDEYRRVTRRAREVVERVFYGRE